MNDPINNSDSLNTGFLDEPESDFLAALLLRAEENKHSEFTFIRSHAESIVISTYKKASYEVYKKFKRVSKKVYKMYLKSIHSDTPQLELLVSSVHCSKAADFYKKEVKIMQDIKAEYRSYILGGHILHTILGRYRPDEELVDYRTLPFTLFGDILDE